MGGVKYIGYMVPVVLVLVLLEWQISKLKGKKVYQFNDTMVNMCCGMLERLFDLFFVVFLHFMFEFVYENFTMFKIPSNAFTWIIGLFVADFLAYWHHRLSHEINFLWAAHVVHHQSEELNLTTVFRVSAFAVINRAFFFIWLPIIGFSPALSTSLIIFIGLFQFLTHTRLVGKLGILEYIFVTPSTHRVHHGFNEKYIDKNYGHVFIIWDRLLGTYCEEEEEPVYGITTGFDSSNAFWAYLAYWVSLFSRASKLETWKARFQVFFKPPSWNPDDQSQPKDIERKRTHLLNVPPKLRIYVLFNVILTTTAFIILLINKKVFPMGVIFQLSLGVVMAIMTIGLLMDQKLLGWKLELFRLFVFGISFSILIHQYIEDPILVILILSIHLAIAFWVYNLKSNFTKKDIQTKTTS